MLKKNIDYKIFSVFFVKKKEEKMKSDFMLISTKFLHLSTNKLQISLSMYKAVLFLRVSIKLLHLYYN